MLDTPCDALKTPQVVVTLPTTGMDVIDRERTSCLALYETTAMRIPSISSLDAASIRDIQC